MFAGKIKMFSPDRGFGFITRDDGAPDAFVHISAVLGGYTFLVEGQQVRFEIGEGRNGKPCAFNVTPVGPIILPRRDVPTAVEDEFAKASFMRPRSP